VHEDRGEVGASVRSSSRFAVRRPAVVNMTKLLGRDQEVRANHQRADFGNSLLAAGWIESAERITSSRMHLSPIFPPETLGTGYYDWFYGATRIFRQGARPQVVWSSSV